MKVLKVSPCKTPVVIEIDGELETLQKEVGGYIEVVYPFDESVVIICNKEGKLLGLPFNRALYCNGIIEDILCGDFLIAEEDENGDFASMSEENIKIFTEMFGSNSYIELVELF